jgi:hypothetical protein
MIQQTGALWNYEMPQGNCWQIGDILSFTESQTALRFFPISYFLLPPPRDRSSRLRWRGSSREPLATAAREREVALDSPAAGLTLWVLDGRLPLLLENSLLDRVYCCSLGSADMVGLLLDAIALRDALPVREDVWGLSTVRSPDRSVLCIWENGPPWLNLHSATWTFSKVHISCMK